MTKYCTRKPKKADKYINDIIASKNMADPPKTDQNHLKSNAIRKKKAAPAAKQTTKVKVHFFGLKTLKTHSNLNKFVHTQIA